jgi:hypothetical protein
MNTLTKATDQFIQLGASPTVAEQAANDYLAVLRLLVREGFRQEQESRKESADDYPRHA